MNNYTDFYTRASKLSNYLLRLFILLYCTFFGVFESFGRMRDTATKLALLDLLLISCIHMFLLLLALNFQWSSKALLSSGAAKPAKRDAGGQIGDGVKAENGDEDEEEDEDEYSGVLFKARNSIALHHLRLSRRDVEALKLSQI